MNERGRVLTGRCRQGSWRLRLRQPTSGEPASVEVDWAWALQREETHGDVMGFYHTHPGMPAVPSARDVATMRAWVSCLGKPLLCVIQSGADLAAYLMESDQDLGRPMPRVERRAGWLAVWREEPADDRAVCP